MDAAMLVGFGTDHNALALHFEYSCKGDILFQSTIHNSESVLMDWR
jgi:hypothetical protein